MTITQTTDKASICALLSAHIGQRSGIKTGDYVSDWRDKEGLKALRSEQYSVARDGQEARLLLDVLQKVTKYGYLAPNDSTGQTMYQFRVALLDQATAAIAKALGN